MPLRPFALERFFASHEFSSRYLLCASDCESMSVRELACLEPGGLDALHDAWLGYSESPGSPALREEIRRLYSSLAADHVLVHAGAEEAVFVFMHALCRPGDHVIVQHPCYQSLAEVARSLGCAVTPWHMRSDPAWSLDPDDLERLATPETRGIVINSPHNPTGYQMPLEVFRTTVRFAESRGITLFSDEVYRGLEQDGAEPLPAACDLSESAVSLGVMSKTYGLPGLRIGWAATRAGGLLARMAEIKDYTSICAAGPSEILAGIALRHGRGIVDRNRRIIATNLDVLDGFFSDHTSWFEWSRPVAGPIAFPRLRRGDVDEFSDRLVREAGVLLLPGSVFGDHTNRFRIGFGRRNMPEAAARLGAYIDGLDREQRAGQPLC